MHARPYGGSWTGMRSCIHGRMQHLTPCPWSPYGVVWACIRPRMGLERPYGRVPHARRPCSMRGENGVQARPPRPFDTGDEGSWTRRRRPSRPRLRRPRLRKQRPTPCHGAPSRAERHAVTLAARSRGASPGRGRPRDPGPCPPPVCSRAMRRDRSRDNAHRPRTGPRCESPRLLRTSVPRPW